MFLAHVRNIGGIKRTSMKRFLVACDSPGVAQQFPQPQSKSLCKNFLQYCSTYNMLLPLLSCGASLPPQPPSPLLLWPSLLPPPPPTPRQSFSRHRLTTWPPSRSIRWLADANGLVAALVDATDLGPPVLQMRPFPPPLYQ